jgi:hypothetical protein
MESASKEYQIELALNGMQSAWEEVQLRLDANISQLEKGLSDKVEALLEVNALCIGYR